uniref:Fatty acid desaturase domain-containing protein n=1 Tax=Aplanochytrium stocchinoi TaxID=215587 RepID=A0A7S3LG85_9STRA|mmetsp:Transcript_5892/g.6993  ORF Transcript_5892/g.6993 Transcript_5892/m.6993 type:complete len:392 (+) Transcript_5892:202-1377(+)|eukprot:CAMPEP_0204829992 /NCGR_PEP_ID=MMETSP1346-20131115/8263_1 /ASSEMBLY_ACC=CAM_ASM_000771 /TAXON_ID=215587 /ORGANISM="Aplanochytrium stocchinoi, Strain GSBS06" /LENGTH=391 /DNA_ID=CAMNT_0051960095 /DNA_START=88 /DNA_END=1263 /DNA_ORIENTATION=-
MCNAKIRQVSNAKDAQKKDPLPSIGEIRAVVPKHCFERSLVKGLYYLGRDTFWAALVGFAAYKFLPTDDLSNPLVLLGWLIYGFVEGTILTGHWVLAHECGHEAFSDYQIVNDLIGFTLHTVLLVPYFSWQYSHGVHHARVNHILDGESHVPDVKRKVVKMYLKVVDAIGEEAFAVLQVVLHLLLGWPLYLILGITGSKRRHNGERYKKRPNHFNPYSELFPDRLRFKVAVSTLGLIGWSACLIYLGNEYGYRELALFYFLPYLTVNGWLVLYTWLQHTHEDIPHYGEDEWSWLKGTLCTIDRPYPAWADYCHHHIGSSHVAHHLWSKMPFYGAVEATKHIKEFLGPHYRYDGTPIVKAMLQTGRKCHYVEDASGVQYMHSVFDEKRPKKL